MSKAELYFKQKIVLNCRLLRDIVIWKVDVSYKYPDGVRYHLTLVDPISGTVFVLFDNHFPKGHHRHDRFDKEHVYKFKNMKSLIEDYLEIENEEVKLYEKNEN